MLAVWPYSTSVVVLLSSTRSMPVLPSAWQFCSSKQRRLCWYGATNNNCDEIDNNTSSTSSAIAGQFKILTCNASACTEKRKRLGLDEFATFSAFYARAAPTCITVEETSSCLGACQQAPCVGVTHEDFVGTVALRGMTPAEFANRVFYRIIDEEDVDRVWTCVENAVEFLMNDQHDEILDEEMDRYI